MLGISGTIKIIFQNLKKTSFNNTNKLILVDIATAYIEMTSIDININRTKEI